MLIPIIWIPSVGWTLEAQEAPMAQLFKAHPTAHGEHVPGLPEVITDEWLAQAAADRDTTPEKLSAEIVAYRRADGAALYRPTPKAREELGAAAVPPAPEPAEKPRVPLGSTPKGH